MELDRLAFGHGRFGAVPGSAIGESDEGWGKVSGQRMVKMS
jgi:hypothetical protein